MTSTEENEIPVPEPEQPKNGPVVDGANGFDFKHRETVASHYQISVVNKSRLKICIFFHYMLFFVMLVKLLPEILDRLDIFIMELEELFVPKPLLWEYLWCCSLVITYYGLSAAKRNKIGGMQFYIIGTFLFGLCPILYCAWHFYSDLSVYMETRDTSKVRVWQGIPISVMWFIFITAAFQVHIFSIYFAERLIISWKARGAKKLE